MRILATAPSRISLFGGGTDIEPFAYSYSFGGNTISLAINLRTQVILLSGDDKWGESSHTFPYDADPRLFYEILNEYGINGHHHVRILSSFDGQINAGLGSSGSAGVALIAAIHKMKGLTLNPKEIAEKAYQIEVNKTGYPGGRQDQYITALGGLQYIEFTSSVNNIPLDKSIIQKIHPYLMLFYIGKRKYAKEIQRNLFKLSDQSAAFLKDIVEITNRSLDSIIYGDMKKVGKLLHEAWELKKLASPGASNPTIDLLYSIAINNGAYGGKILGAGGGGYMMFLCPPDKQIAVTKALLEQHIERVDFSPDFNGIDARIL